MSEKVVCSAQGGLCMNLMHTTNYWRCVDGRWQSESFGTCAPEPCADCDAGTDAASEDAEDAPSDVQPDAEGGEVDAGEAGEAGTD